MPVSWTYAADVIRLGGHAGKTIGQADAERQDATARSILSDLARQPGVILADEVGMGKTYVALAAIASAVRSERENNRPVVVMVPHGLIGKWPREWDQFKALCCENPQAFDWVRDIVVRSPTEFFQKLDDPKSRRPHIIWMPTGCFSTGLQDPWIKLALIRLARTRTRMDDEAKKRLYKWASSLVRLRGRRGLTPEVIEQLMGADLTAWHEILLKRDLLESDSDDPVPEHLLRHRKALDLSGLAAVLRGEIPGRQGALSTERLKVVRWGLNEECQKVYWQWLRAVRWRAPLLVLDEAHHAKNDSTRLASLFRSEDTQRLMTGGESGDKPLLWDKFDRMLFLTATPFQLGHQELIRVLRSFAAANWSTRVAPASTRESFLADLKDLEQRLDENRMSGRRLDRLWGRLQEAKVVASGQAENGIDSLSQWWARVATAPRDPLEIEICRAVDECKRTKRRAEQDEDRPWAALRTWVVRHNRPTTLPGGTDGLVILRREVRPGVAILGDEGDTVESDRGLPIAADQALPFLLAARAQGELAHGSSKARAFFAEGLCSSYEAFHHTRDQGDGRDVDDDGYEMDRKRDSAGRVKSLVPVSWYETQIAKLVPSREAPEEERGQHPKLSAVVERVARLWRSGEKVLVFCFYRQTAQALRAHIGRAIDDAVVQLAGERLGLDPKREASEVRDWLEGIVRRLGDAKSPFNAEIMRQLRGPFGQPEFAVLRDRADDFVSLLAAYVRSPTFIARYLPLDVKEVRDALVHGESRAPVVRAGVEALMHALAERPDGSAFTMNDRVTEFLRFAKDLAERAQRQEDGRRNLLEEYVHALAVYVSPRRNDEDDDEEARRSSRVPTYRVLPTVRMVYGDTKQEVRDRLMLAFNSPLFPEILISSAVLAEGVDLHRFCRHVIHHDLCWNPSTLEQRTGRVDRIRCKAELARRPIVIHQPYIAGSADEKMFRVVRDRERWFQIVMGQKFEMDEASSEKLAHRMPLPDELAAELVFDLRRAGK